jgi:hypothetical protein
MGTDTAAILSQIPRGPSQWSRVTIGRADADGHYPLTVKPRRGYATTVLLTDGEMVSEVARFLRSPLSAATTPAEKRRLERAFRNARFHVAIDTDSAKVAPGGDEGPPPPAPTGTTRALKASVPGKKAPKKAAPKRSPAKKKAAPKKAAKKAPKKARRAPAKKASFGELVGQAVADAATTAETGLVELADTLADELTPAQLQRVIERLQRRLT